MGRKERGRELGRRKKGSRCQSRRWRKLCNVHLMCRRSRRTLHRTSRPSPLSSSPDLAPSSSSPPSCCLPSMFSPASTSPRHPERRWRRLFEKVLWLHLHHRSLFPLFLLLPVAHPCPPSPLLLLLLFFLIRLLRQVLHVGRGGEDGRHVGLRLQVRLSHPQLGRGQRDSSSPSCLPCAPTRVVTKVKSAIAGRLTV